MWSFLSAMHASNLHTHITEFSELIQLEFVHRIYCIENYDKRSLKSRLNSRMREWFFAPLHTFIVALGSAFVSDGL